MLIIILKIKFYKYNIYISKIIMPKKTPNKKNKETEEEEIEEEVEKEEIKENQEEKEIEKEEKEDETPKKKKKKRKKSKNKTSEEIENTEEKADKEEKNEEETKTKKSKKKKKKKKKIEKEETEEKEENENIKENKIEEDNINNKEKEKENNNVQEDNKENEENKENNINQEEINNNINNENNEEKKDEEEKQEKDEKEEKQEEQNLEKKEEVKKEEIKQEENVEENQEEEINTKKNIKKNKKEKEKEKEKKAKNKKQNKKRKKEIEEEEEEENENEAEENEEDFEEQETSPTERKKSKKIKEPKKPSKYHLNPKFENEINLAYKKLQKIDTINTDEYSGEEEEEENEEDMTQSQIKSDIVYCEKKLRSALKICQNDPYMIINRNIIDKLSRISLHERINLNYILGNIYISLMNREALFDYEDEENFEINDLLIFINKVIQFREEMKNTNINISYDESLKQFLYFITEQFELEESQLKNLKKILEEETDIDHSDDIVTNKTLNYFINLLNKELESQPNLYEQFEIFIQNKKKIIQLIEECDPEEQSKYNDYLNLGKCLTYMFFNSHFNIYAEKNMREDEEEDDDIGEMLLFYNGNKNRGEINIINGEKFCIYMDDKIKYLRKKLIEIIIIYCEQFIDIIDAYQIQYIIFILITRIYSCKYKKYNESINSILADSLINMCFFKKSPIKLISNFINKILESENQENTDLKNLILKKIKEVKNEEGFLYQMPEELEKKYKDKKIKVETKKIQVKTPKKKQSDDDEDSDEDETDDIETGEKYEDMINDENLFILHNDLKFGYFNQKVIKSRDKFILFEEINQDYSVLDFCFTLSDLDVNLTITDMTEDKIIFYKEKITNKETPYKFLMFFTNPRILKFEFDNSYSWLRSKTIKFKTNIFYPKYPYLINHQILLGKYINVISKTKKENTKKKYKGKKKVINYDNDKLLIIKFNEKHKVFNCNNVKGNLDTINYLVKNKFLSVSSIYIKIKEDKNNIEDKSNFYYYSKEKKDIIENELTQDNFDNVLSQILPDERIAINIINLFVINGDNNNINYSNYTLRKLLGFEPSNVSKTLFFIQNLNQAQLLYNLFKQMDSDELSDDVVILLNYTKYFGYQLSLFDNDEIIDFCEHFNGLNKNNNLDDNIKIVCDGIKKLELDEDRKVKIILCSSIDEKENEITPENIENKLKEIFGKEENGMKNVNIIKIDNEFNKEVENYSNIFYLDN